MREIRQSGSEGGARFNPSFLPLSVTWSLRDRFGSMGTTDYLRVRCACSTHLLHGCGLGVSAGNFN
jgi:hypothetical protein